MDRIGLAVGIPWGETARMARVIEEVLCMIRGGLAASKDACYGFVVDVLIFTEEGATLTEATDDLFA